MSAAKRAGRRFGYDPAAAPFVYATWLGAAATAVACTLIAIAAVWIQIERMEFDPRGLLLAVVSLVLGWGVLFFFWALYPTVAVEQDAVRLSFPVGAVRLPWSDLVSIRLPGNEGRGSAVVLARRITPFHVLYGLIYARTLAPAFLLGWPLQQRDEALRELRRHLAKR